MNPGRKTVDRQKRLRRLCAVVAAEDAGAMGRQVRLALAQTPTVELRLDWLRNDNERERFLRWLARQKFAGARFIATCRRVEGGGRFTEDVRGELFWLARAREARCTWCDLELESVRKLPGRSVQAARKAGVPRRVLLSVHDFARTPALPRSLAAPPYGDADAVKIAAHATKLGDGLRLLRLAERSRKFVGVPMGDVGLDRCDQYLPLSLVRARLRQRWTLTETSYRTGGPARYFDVAETGTRIGFITPMTHNFCESCNRVRLTCTGTLYMCLGQDDAAEFRPLLRSGADDDVLEQAIRGAIARKPKGHDFEITRGGSAVVARPMSRTGG